MPGTVAKPAVRMYEQTTHDIAQDYYQQNYPNDGQRFVAETATVFVVQGKFTSSASVDAEPLREVLSAWVQTRDLVRLQEVANAKLKQKISRDCLRD